MITFRVVCLLLLSVFEIWQSGVHGAPSRTSSEVMNKNDNVELDQQVLSDPTEALEIPQISEHDAEAMLRGLGYNEINNQNDSETLGLRFAELIEPSVTDLIRIFQRDYGLQETGVLDDETKLVIGSPHCGFRKSAKLKDGVRKWSKRWLTYRIKNFPSGKRTGPIKTMLMKAFNEWSKVTHLDFMEVDDADPDIEISFGGRSHKMRGEGCIFEDPKTLAHAYFPEIGDVHFNSNYFFDGDVSLEDFLDTAMHEIGHSLGLEHSSSRASLMHPTESNRFSEPQPMDVQQIQSLYGVRRGGRSIQTTAPKLCSLNRFDAALDDEDGNAYILAGNYYYNVIENNPTGLLISSKWPGLPGDIDAAFRYSDGRSYFFKGNKYWRFKNGRLDAGHPRLISSGFPGLPDNIGALFVDGNGNIFAFKGSQYWFYVVKQKRVSAESPGRVRTMGLPSNIEAALDTDSLISVIKADVYYELQKDGDFKMRQNRWVVCY